MAFGQVFNIPEPDVDKSKPYVNTIREAARGGGINNILDFTGNNKALSVIVDTFSGRYYGENRKEDFTDFYDSTIKRLQNDVAYMTANGSLPRDSTKGFSLSNLGVNSNLSPEDYTSTLADYNARINTATAERSKFDNYEQRPQMLASFNANPSGWNKYFESNYKNPRIAESDASGAQFISQDNAQSALAIKAKTHTPKTVGTGTGLTSVGLNPFGRLDAGLGI